MSDKDIIENLKDPENLRFQVGRLMSDAESEKEVRKRLNKEVADRLKVLEDDKVARDTIIKFLAIANIGTIITLVIALVKVFSR